MFRGGSRDNRGITNWQAGFVLAAILLSDALGAALLGQPEGASNRVRSLVLFVLAGMLAVYPLGWQGRAEVPVWLAFLLINLFLALGPRLFFHVQSVARRAVGRRWAHLTSAAVQLAFLIR